MITIISGTNRLESNTRKVAQYYVERLEVLGKEVFLFSLEDLPDDLMEVSKYTDQSRSKEFERLQDEVLIPTEKYIFILPEYNGSIPGILKLLIDSCAIEDCFYNKKACLVGLASGRGGNVRGLDHLTNILHYLKMQILPDKLPISRIQDELDANGNLSQLNTLEAVNRQIDAFIEY